MPVLIISRLLATAIFGLLSTNCVSQDMKKMRPGSTQQQMNQLIVDMKQLIGDANCSSKLQCSALPIGTKPCGGPWSYLVYSTQNMDVEKLKELSTHHGQLNKKYNKESGLMSDCSMAIQPATACVDNRCVPSPES